MSKPKLSASQKIYEPFLYAPEPEVEPLPEVNRALYMSVTVPLVRLTGGGTPNPAAGGEPYARLLSWARNAAGHDLGMIDIAVSLDVHSALRYAERAWLGARVASGFLAAEDVGRVSLGIEGHSAPVLNRNLPSGQALLVRKPN